MKTAVRFCSRSGNTKAAAEAIANAVGAEAVSVDDADAAIAEPVDVLFIGGAVYAHGLDARLKRYLKTLSQRDAGRAVLFSVSWYSKHGLDLMRKELTERGIPVADEVFHIKGRGRPDEAQLKNAAAFARKHV
ncbi:MAG: flavodoxin family protein [Bacillota bacterium]|jgi:flavodoxin